ncbi:interleukin-4 receptor subunit alpha isoform X2 [Hemicordylus capensis]|uniref:interleukin-4 receptor subunit alpha isoform X2 n=1 Tax=Hemicordylus capensis TaxID=884348 RepID=UPI002303E782|nr:interleukin-4 receptor subunit alpha isoform X2 [Hemicordylus capensis]
MAAAAGLWWSLFFPCCLLGRHASEGVSPDCHLDFDNQLVCHWKVESTTNCAEEFLLSYEKYDPDLGPLPQKSNCTPKSGSSPDGAPECLCVMPEEHFEYATYHIVLEANGTRTYETSRPADQMVKLRPLINLTVNKKERTFVLSWSWNYTQESYFDKYHRAHALEYEVAYWAKGKDQQYNVKKKQEPRYVILASNLESGATYVAKVRFHIEQFGSWSEWSAPCEWQADPEDQLWLMPLCLCALVMALMFAGYFCFSRLKAKWWDRIPSPARSTMAKQMSTKPLPVVRRIWPLRGGEASAPDTCWEQRCCGSSPGGPSRVMAPGRSKAGVCLTPELTRVDHPLAVCSRKAAGGPGGLRGAEADPAPHEEAMAALFVKLLDGDFSTTEDAGAQLEPRPGALGGGGGFSSPAAGSLEPFSKSGYGSSRTEAAPPWMVAPVLEDPHNQGLPTADALPHAPHLPLDSALATDAMDPWTDCQGASSGPAAQPSGYKCFDGLLLRPMASCSQVGEQQPSPPPGDPIQAPGSERRAGCADPAVAAAAQGVFPGGGLDAPWQLPSCKAAVQQQGLACSAAPLFSGYRSFSSALQSSTHPPDDCSSCPGLAPPYKPFHSVFEASPTETPTGRDCLDPHPGPWEAAAWKAWPSAPWEEGPGGAPGGLHVEGAAH